MLWASFSRQSAKSLLLFSLLSTFWRLLSTVYFFSLTLHSTKKGMQTGVRYFCQAKTNNIAKHVYTRQFAFSIAPAPSFDSGTNVACFVRMRDDVLSLHNLDNN